MINTIFFYALPIKDVLVTFKDICMYLYLFLNGIFYINPRIIFIEYSHAATRYTILAALGK